MTTATATTTKVPVRDWREKAILAAIISKPLPHHYERLASAYALELPNIEYLLHDDRAVDVAIDAYTDARAPIVAIETLLAALRDVTPGPEATLELPDGDVQLLHNLDELIDEFADCNVVDLAGAVSQRAIAEATVLTIDLRDELVGA